MLLTALTGVAFPSNPICRNTDKSLVNLYKCYSFGESQFISLRDGLPTFSDGATMGREGSSRWENKRIRLCDAEKTYKKNGIVFSICSIGVYVCSYEVLKSDEVTIADLDFRYDGGEYLINYYDCKYEKAKCWIRHMRRRIFNGKRQATLSNGKFIAQTEPSNLWAFSMKDTA